MRNILAASESKKIINGIVKEEPNSELVNLVFASDNKYIPYTVTTLASILKNYSGKQKIHVYFLLDKDLESLHIENIEKLKEISPFNYTCINVDASNFEGIKTSDGISIATYYRLLMHDILPENVEKALYLDSDLIILDSIEKLYNESFKGNLFAGVEDSISIDYNKKFGIPSTGKHINAGVLLLNLKLIRQFNFLERILNFIDLNRYRITLGDQQILCELFYDLIKYVPVKWNVHGSMFLDTWVTDYVNHKNNINKKEVIEAIKNPSIIHYTLKRKPWMSLQHPKSELWFEYSSITGYGSTLIKPKKEAPAKKPQANVGEATFTGLDKYKISANTASIKKRNLYSKLKKVLPGYFLSIKKARKTRLLVEEISNKFNGFIDVVSFSNTAGNNSKSNTVISTNNLGGLPTGPTTKVQKRKTDLHIKLKEVLISRSPILPDDFNASDFVDSLPINSSIQSNLVGRDVDGGQNENLKSIFKTSNILYEENKKAETVIIHSLRINQGMFWDSIEYAFLYDKPLIFSEVSFFSGYASFYDKHTTLEERRAFGFILDDMGYYFDARQPSRLEMTLNNENYSLNEDQIIYCKKLIQRIIKNKITKYNKYASSNPTGWKINNNSILVIEQKMDDASIIFSDGHVKDFQNMIDDACKNNQNKTVYFKRHPDNILSQKDNGLNLEYENLIIVPDFVPVTELLDSCNEVYTISSQVGFEALLRGLKVVTYGKPFYSGWGLTVDKYPLVRRKTTRTIEEIFYAACIKLSVYFDAKSNKKITFEESLDYIENLKRKNNNV
ncbi:glycosyltransferase [Pantoea sp. A4]|uniref:glycosyltransferase n=1 Tax=Pantoea sp. A4 TaxID=1225184 RepID=UPI000365497B|nr:glycosyltransferase [Pantoea sp. A4]